LEDYDQETQTFLISGVARSADKPLVGKRLPVSDLTRFVL
jgi:hypothetical protein